MNDLPGSFNLLVYLPKLLLDVTKLSNDFSDLGLLAALCRLDYPMFGLVDEFKRSREVREVEQAQHSLQFCRDFLDRHPLPFRLASQPRTSRSTAGACKER